MSQTTTDKSQGKRELRALRWGMLYLLIASILLWLCVCVFLFGRQWVWETFLRDMLFTKPPESTSVLPVPPDAREIIRLDAGEGSKVVTYTTSLRSDAVLAFYDETLRNDSWSHPLTIGGNYPPNIFGWHQAGPDGPTHLAYRLTIVTTDEADGTRVVSNRITFDPIE